MIRLHVNSHGKNCPNLFNQYSQQQLSQQKLLMPHCHSLCLKPRAPQLWQVLSLLSPRANQLVLSVLCHGLLSMRSRLCLHLQTSPWNQLQALVAAFQKLTGTLLLADQTSLRHCQELSQQQIKSLLILQLISLHLAQALLRNQLLMADQALLKLLSSVPR